MEGIPGAALFQSRMLGFLRTATLDMRAERRGDFYFLEPLPGPDLRILFSSWAATGF